MTKRDFDMVKTEIDWTEALGIIITTNNLEQLESLLNYIQGDAVPKRKWSLPEVTGQALAKHFAHSEEKEFAELLRTVLNRDDSFDVFLNFYTSFTVPLSVIKMRKILPLLDPQRAKWHQFIAEEINSVQYRDFMRLMAASTLFCDSETFSQLVLEFKTFLLTITDEFREVSNGMPSHLKSHFQPYYQNNAWNGIQQEMRGSVKHLNTLPQLELIDIKESSIKEELANTAANLFNCSTCSALMKILCLDIKRPTGFCVDSLLRTVYQLLLETKELTPKQQCRRRKALKHVAQELKKTRQKATRNEIQQTSLWNRMRNVYEENNTWIWTWLIFIIFYIVCETLFFFKVTSIF